MGIITLSEQPRAERDHAPMLSKESGKLVAKLPGKGEVLLASLLALAAYTSLMLKMPYRAPIINSLYTVVGLSAVYLYFRLRLSIRVPPQALLCLVIGALLDIIGNHFDLFSRGFFSIPYDSITHFITCGLTFIVVMWLVMALMNRYGYQLPLGLLAFFSATTTYSLSAYYEITELIDERFFGGHRLWTPHDTVQDLAVDLAGITVAAVGYTIYLKRRRRLMIRAAISTVDK